MSPLIVPGLGPLAWIDVILLGWFALTLASVIYVAWDCYANNPELTVMKWGWILVTLYMGPIAFVLYVMSCKEPFPGTHTDAALCHLGRFSAGACRRRHPLCDACQPPSQCTRCRRRVAAAITALLGLPM